MCLISIKVNNFLYSKTIGYWLSAKLKMRLFILIGSCNRALFTYIFLFNWIILIFEILDVGREKQKTVEADVFKRIIKFN